MKTKKIVKKLSLNKNTISNLDITEMSKLNGGINETNTCICPTLEPSCSLCPPSGPVGPTCIFTQEVIDSICILCSAPKTKTDIDIEK